MKTTARSQAARLIAEVIAGQSLAGRMPGALDAVPARERALCQELLYGTLREWPLIDGLLGQLLQKPLKKKDADIRALIACGIYQLGWMRLPAHAAVSETVATVATLGKSWARGLVNGVLRNYQRRGATLVAALDNSAQAALPHWLHQQLQAQWPTQLPDIAQAARSHPPMHLRVNTQRQPREQLILDLAQAGIDARCHPKVESAIVLSKAADVDALPGFADGIVSVQDAAAQLAAVLLAAQPGEQVLDACAAPGGKSGHIAELLGPLSELLIAADPAEKRLSRIRENRDRLGLNFAVERSDARQPSDAITAHLYDAVLVDAPCSATGVLRRNPDVKVIRRASDIDQFAALQREILTGVWPLLKPGGRLLYATCSLLEMENDAVIDWALEHLSNAVSAPLTHPMTTATRHGVQALPSLDNGDGLYYALLRKAD